MVDSYVATHVVLMQVHLVKIYTDLRLAMVLWPLNHIKLLLNFRSGEFLAIKVKPQQRLFRSTRGLQLTKGNQHQVKYYNRYSVFHIYCYVNNIWPLLICHR